MATLRVRDWIALIVLGTGITLAFKADNWVTSLMWVVSGMAFAVAVLNPGAAFEDLSLTKVLGGLAAMLGLVGAIFGGGYLNSDRAAFNQEVQDLFLRSSARMYGPIDDRALKIADVGFRLCATQRYTDAADLALAAGSAMYMPNSASLATGVWDAMSTLRQRPDCMSAYLAFRELAPELVVGIERRYGGLTRKPG